MPCSRSFSHIGVVNYMLGSQVKWRDVRRMGRPWFVFVYGVIIFGSFMLLLSPLVIVIASSLFSLFVPIRSGLPDDFPTVAWFIYRWPIFAVSGILLAIRVWGVAEADFKRGLGRDSDKEN